MAVLSDYVAGTITVTNGSTVFTGDGTLWRVAGFREGDTVQLQGYTAIIAGASARDPMIEANGSGNFTEPWTGASGTYAYRMRYLPDNARVTAETRNLIELLGSGVLHSLAGLDLAEGDYIRALGSGILGRIAGKRLDQLIALTLDNGDYLKAAAGGALGKIAGKNLDMLAGLTAAADKMPFYDTPNSMALTDLTSYARTLLGRANGGQVYSDLGIIPDVQIPERIRERIFTNTTDCNAAVQSGWYYVSGSTANRPSPTNVVGMMLSLFQLPAYGTQIFYDRQDGSQSQRRICVNGVWSPWTKLSLADFSQSISGNGWNMLPNGKYEQWGTAVVTLNASFAGTVTLPTAFPNNHFTSTLTNGDWGVAAARQASLVLVGSSQPRNQINFAVSGLSAPVTMRVNFTSVGN